MTLVDKFLPSPDFHEKHTIVIEAPASAVWAACQQLDLRNIRLARPFFSIRDGIARLLYGHGQQDIPKMHGSMVPLAEEFHREIVEGLVGQWWKFGAPVRQTVRTLQEYLDFAEPGYAKATISFQLEEDATGNRTRLTTETRVICLDDSARRAMGRYWLLIRPFSGIIRRLILATIRQHALRHTASNKSR